MRLNAAMKIQVIKKAMDHRFKKRIKDHDDERKALGLALWDSIYGTHKRTIAKLPKDLFTYPTPYHDEKEAPVSFTIGGQYHPYPLSPTLPISTLRMQITDRALIDRHRACLAEAEALRSDTEKVKTTLTAMLQNMQTFARLEQDWPEGKPFYHSLPVDFPFNHNVPAVQVKELNTLLGLAT